MHSAHDDFPAGLSGTGPAPSGPGPAGAELRPPSSGGLRGRMPANRLREIPPVESRGRIRTRTGWPVAALGAAASLLVTVGSCALFAPPAGASITPTAHELLQEVLGASAKAASLSFVTTTTGGSQDETVKGAVSAAAASETVTGIGTPFEVELVGQTVYVHGDSAALQGALQLTAQEASTVAGRWVAVTPTDSAFSALTSALTVTTAINVFIPSSGIRQQSRTRIHGQVVIPLVGRPTLKGVKGASGSVALLVNPRTHLPVGGTLIERVGKQTVKEVAEFKNWGATVSVDPPTTTISILSIISNPG